MASVVILGTIVLLLGYVLIEIWGLESLLAKTSFIGMMAAFLVLTSSIWLPDLFYGLVLLGSSMTEEGDTISLGGLDRLCIISRLTPFYALLLDVDNNHRTILRNSDLIRMGIDNFTKRASVDGVRRKVEFKLGYPEGKEFPNGVSDLFNKVDQAVAQSSERAQRNPKIMVHEHLPFEWSLIEAGDDALKFSVFYHLAPLPETKLTSKIRLHLRATDNAIVRLIFEESSARGLKLATPSLLKIEGPAAMPGPETQG